MADTQRLECILYDHDKMSADDELGRCVAAVLAQRLLLTVSLHADHLCQ